MEVFLVICNDTIGYICAGVLSGVNVTSPVEFSFFGLTYSYAPFMF